MSPFSGPNPTKRGASGTILPPTSKSNWNRWVEWGSKKDRENVLSSHLVFYWWRQNFNRHGKKLMQFVGIHFLIGTRTSSVPFFHFWHLWMFRVAIQTFFNFWGFKIAPNLFLKHRGGRCETYYSKTCGHYWHKFIVFFTFFQVSRSWPFLWSSP